MSQTLFIDSLSYKEALQIYSIVKKHFSSVDGIFKYVSKFNFLKSRTAIASCLLSTNKEEKYPFILLCIDLSGIQDFIYSIHNSKAAMAIKGRSFYVELLMKSIEEQIVRTQNENLFINPTNLIYTAGGKSYFLLPNEKNFIRFLEDLENDVSKILYNDYGETIALCMDFISFQVDLKGQTQTGNWAISSPDIRKDGLPISGINDLWVAVSEKTAGKKRKKYEKFLLNQYDDFFSEKGLEEEYRGDNSKICAVSGIVSKDTEEIKPGIYVSSQVKKQIDLGKSLKDAQFLEICMKEPLNPLNWLNVLGLYFKLSNRNDLTQEADSLYVINPKNDSYFDCFEDFILYGGLQEVDDFSLLSESDELTRFDKLAILKMDVDNLGKLFENGIYKDNPIFEFYVAASDSIKWFFSGFINLLKEPYINRINILYSGGDDLCVVGRWWEIILFARDVRESFRKYTNNNDKLTISAGIEIIDTKFPISRAIAKASDALDLAKSKEFKNSITIFDVVLSWGMDESKNEVGFVLKVAHILKDYLSEEKISRSLLYKLHGFLYSKEVLKNLDWRWKSAYALAKNKNDDNKFIIDAITIAIFTEKFEYDNIVFKSVENSQLKLISLAVQIADYLIR